MSHSVATAIPTLAPEVTDVDLRRTRRVRAVGLVVIVLLVLLGLFNLLGVRGGDTSSAAGGYGCGSSTRRSSVPARPPSGRCG